MIFLRLLSSSDFAVCVCVCVFFFTRIQLSKCFWLHNSTYVENEVHFDGFEILFAFLKRILFEAIINGYFTSY